MTALHMVSHDENTDLAQLLLDHNADIEVKDKVMKYVVVFQWNMK